MHITCHFVCSKVQHVFHIPNSAKKKFSRRVSAAPVFFSPIPDSLQAAKDLQFRLKVNGFGRKSRQMVAGNMFKCW